MNELAMNTMQYNLYPSIINYGSENIATIQSPNSDMDLLFYQTRETLADVDVYRNFLKNAERRFRSSKEYKAYKHFIIEYLGIDRCQIMGNITVEDAEIELHHNVLGLLDICLLISSHIINTIGRITTFDLVQLLIQEHKNNRVGITFLCSTAHQQFTHDPNAYIPPDMTFGRWWELLSLYRYGITYEIANKVISYINKYNKQLPTTINILQNEEILSYAYYNEYGVPSSQIGSLPYKEEYQNQYTGEVY